MCTLADRLGIILLLGKELKGEGRKLAAITLVELVHVLHPVEAEGMAEGQGGSVVRDELSSDGYTIGATRAEATHRNAERDSMTMSTPSVAQAKTKKPIKSAIQFIETANMSTLS